MGKSLPERFFAEKLDPSEDHQVPVEDSGREIGDVSVYLYYVKAVGWIPTVIFVVAISAFVFCMSFPSKSST